jgi:hypothetical protein
MYQKSERFNTMLEAIVFILNTFAKDEVQIQDRFSPEVTTYNAKEIEMKKTDQVFGYKVTIEGTCTVDEWDGEQYGSWHKESDQSIKDLVEKVEEYPDVISTLDIPSGGNALVVWVVWSSGDSFGNHSGGYAEAVGIFTDINAARELQKHIDSIDWQKTHELNFKTSDGQHFDIGFCGWAGYFEHVDSVNLDVVKVF